MALFRKREAVASSYTDLVLSQIVATAGGDTAAVGCAAIETAAGYWGRGLASASLEPALPVLTASLRDWIGRSLIRQGEAVLLIDIQDGQISLLPAARHEVKGGSQRESWRYSLEIAGPTSTTKHKSVSGESILHFRYGFAADQPHKGIPPWKFADISAEMLGFLERRLAQECSAEVGAIIPVPLQPGPKTDVDGETFDPLAGIKDRLKKLGGRLAFVESTRGGMGEGKMFQPQDDWKQRRIGADPPSSLIELRADLSRSILAACGVPPALGSDASADGTSQRESWRRFLHATIQPAALLIAEELTARLGRAYSLDFKALFASDLSGRARAFGSMVKAGMDLQKAAGLAGLLLEE